MENLDNITAMNKSIDKLRRRMSHLMYEDSRRCVYFDSVVLIKVGKLRTNYEKLIRTRNKQLKLVYSQPMTRPKTAPAKLLAIEHHLAPSKPKVLSITIGKNYTKLEMTPDWFKPDDDDQEIEKTIKYPPKVTNQRPFNTIARFRSMKTKSNDSNDFTSEPIEVKQDATETLVLALDAFVQRFGGKLSFTTNNLSFEESTHRAACGVANLGGVHLLAGEHIPSAKFALIVDIDYDELAQSEDGMEQFILTFVNAVAQDLSCDNNFVRVSSIEKSKKGKGKAEINLVLTTPDKTKTEELADVFKDHARMGFSDDTILVHIKPNEYECKWMPILSYLQLQPSDFNPLYNFDYTQEHLPEEQVRANLPYFLPRGWYRHALNVDKKYKDGSRWLGSANIPGEWPVVFHGTRSVAVKSIADKGLLTNSVVRDVMLEEAITQKGEAVNRAGLYVATHCNGGSHPSYTEKFDVPTPAGKTESFQVVFQCRVRPNSYTTHTAPVNVGEAWRLVDAKDIRPYGILLKSTDIKVPFEEDN